MKGILLAILPASAPDAQAVRQDTVSRQTVSTQVQIKLRVPQAMCAPGIAEDVNSSAAPDGEAVSGLARPFRKGQTSGRFMLFGQTVSDCTVRMNVSRRLTACLDPQISIT